MCQLLSLPVDDWVFNASSPKLISTSFKHLEVCLLPPRTWMSGQWSYYDNPSPQVSLLQLGPLGISSSFVWFGGHLSCSFICWVFLCLFILFKLLILGCPFCILAVCGVLFIVEVPHCGLVWMGGLSRFPG